MAKLLALAAATLSVTSGYRMIPHHIANKRPTLSGTYNWIEKNYTQYIDQFNYNGPTSGATFPQRYLYNDTWWKGPGAPIFLYTGNEGFIELFAENSGLVWELAVEFNALVVFSEHRYYGTSLPFGDAAYDTPNLAYLSAEQALVDHVSLIDSLKRNLSATNSPVITFGGSYGGMLAAWAQIRHPGAFAGAIAASAPILQFMGEVDPHLYMGTISNDFKISNPAAFDQIASSWATMATMGATQSGRDALQSALRICDPLTDPTNVTGTVYNWIASALGFMAMADYPYPADFLGPMPAWPVATAAAFFNPSDPSPSAVLSAIYQTMNIFYNYTGQAGQCFELLDLNPPGLTQSGWDYQCCTEVIQSLGQYGPPTDFFWPAPFDFNASVASCQYQYNGTTPRARAGLFQYGGASALRFARNIVFSQGTLDPWSLLGPMTNITGNPSIITVVIKDGAHHLDLRASNPQDPQSVIDARNIERAAIRGWIAEWNEAHGLKREEL